jgi:hypothetical protein
MAINTVGARKDEILKATSIHGSLRLRGQFSQGKESDENVVVPTFEEFDAALRKLNRKRMTGFIEVALIPRELQLRFTFLQSD